MNINNYRQAPQPQQAYNPPVQMVNKELVSADRNIMYGGSTILRNGSNSYRPLPVPENPAVQARMSKFKPLQRTLEPT